MKLLFNSCLLLWLILHKRSCAKSTTVNNSIGSSVLVVSKVEASEGHLASSGDVTDARELLL